MIDHRIKMRHLVTFAETARLGSLSAAALTLNVSQPAASKTIRELETILGITLFDRSARRLRLTQKGKVFQQHAGAALQGLEHAQALVKEPLRQQSKLQIGALPTASTTLLPKAALAMRAQLPDCLLRVSTGPNWLLLSQLREGSIDMVVGRMANADAMEGLSFRPLYTDRVVAVVRPDHPLLADFDLSEIAQYPLMLPPPGAVISPLVKSWLLQNGLPDPRADFETVSLAFGRQVVQSSDCIWFISHGVVQTELAQGSLATLPIADDLLGGPVGVSMRQTAKMTPEQRAFLTVLIDTVEDTKNAP